MLAGVPICALRASAPRTAGKGCSGWPTPNAEDAKAGQSQVPGRQQSSLPRTANWAGWPTQQEDNANNAYGHAGTQFSDLPTTAQLASWATPKVSTGDYQYSGGDKTKPILNLAGQAKLAGWATPNTMDSLPIRSDEALARSKAKAGCANLKDQIPVGPVGGGLKPSIAGTEKRAALNPAHSRWLMGYPAAWDSCGATAMQLSRKSPPNSSKPSKKQSFD